MIKVSMKDYENGCICMLANECINEYDRMYGDEYNESAFNDLWLNRYDTILDSVLLHISFDNAK